MSVLVSVFIKNIFCGIFNMFMLASKTFSWFFQILFKNVCNLFICNKCRNEVEFYTAIMPELLKFQSTKTEEIFKAIPKCYFARSDLLIMGKDKRYCRLAWNSYVCNIFISF